MINDSKIIAKIEVEISELRNGGMVILTMTNTFDPNSKTILTNKDAKGLIELVDDYLYLTDKTNESKK